MKKIVAALSILAFVAAAAGCSSERRTKTSTHETVETSPADPVTTGKRTTVHTETRTSE
ncbi:MAG: hypothetical protein ABR538_07060 [Candidatus Binatia bacterium]